MIERPQDGIASVDHGFSLGELVNEAKLFKPFVDIDVLAQPLGPHRAVNRAASISDADDKRFYSAVASLAFSNADDLLVVLGYIDARSKLGLHDSSRWLGYVRKYVAKVGRAGSDA